MNVTCLFVCICLSSGGTRAQVGRSDQVKSALQATVGPRPKGARSTKAERADCCQGNNLT